MYNPFLGTNQSGASQSGGPNTYGLNSGNLSTTQTAGQYQPGYSGVGGTLPGYMMQGGSQSAAYNSPFGQFTSTSQQNPNTGQFSSFSPWKSQTGQTISDLPGYLQMRGQLQQGADFTGYQNQLNNLLKNPSTIQQTPAYQFALDQGNQAINRSAAAKGALNSGGVLAELAKYGQGMASQEYGNQFNRLADLMRGSQQFGLNAGYYAQPTAQRTPAPGVTQQYQPTLWG